MQPCGITVTLTWKNILESRRLHDIRNYGCFPFCQTDLSETRSTSNQGKMKQLLPIKPGQLRSYNFLFTFPNRPLYSCLLGDLSFEWPWGWRWPCFDTDLGAFVMKMHLVSIRTTLFTQQKQWGLYPSKVISSLPAMQRPGHLADTCKMVCSPTSQKICWREEG